jgi:hypothetical protein
VCSSAYEVCGLVMKPLWSGLDAVCDLGNSLIASSARIRIASRVPYKDVVALAFRSFPLKPVHALWKVSSRPSVPTTPKAETL